MQNGWHPSPHTHKLCTHIELSPVNTCIYSWEAQERCSEGHRQEGEAVISSERMCTIAKGGLGSCALLLQSFHSITQQLAATCDFRASSGNQMWGNLESWLKLHFWALTLGRAAFETSVMEVALKRFVCLCVRTLICLHRIVFRNLNVTLLYVTAMPFIVNNMQPLVFHFIPGLRAQSWLFWHNNKKTLHFNDVRRK